MKNRLIWGAWVALCLMLPITSLPLLQHWIGGWTVNPASAIPLVILVPFGLIPYLVRRGKLPLETVPLLGFLAAAAVATGLAFYLPVSPWKDQSVFSRSFSAWLTLGTGVSFYLVTMTLVDNEKKLIKSLRFVSIGALLMLVWALAQGVFIYLKAGQFPSIMHMVHDFLSIRELSSTKVTGLAFESSWLAHQLNILYFPLWMGAVVQAYSIYKYRISRIPIEALLLVIGIVVLLLAKSRIGLVSFLALVAVILLRFIFGSSRKISQKVDGLFSKLPRWQNRLVNVFTSVLLQLLALAVFVLFVRVFISFASKIDWRLERLLTATWPKLIPFKLSTIVSQFRGLFNVYFANYLMFAERSVYWIAAFRIFEAHPFLGVGPGNAGFFFLQDMPPFAWSLPEVVEVLRDSTFEFPNPKVLWLRLLAETGIAGFTFFVVWLLSMLTRAWQLLAHRDQLYKAIGLAGVLGMAAIVVEGFSLDTFALPYMWVLLGLVSATARMSRTRSQTCPS